MKGIRRQAVGGIVHVLVELVSQAKVEREVVARLPVILRVQMQPTRAAIFVAAADPRGG